MLLSSGSGILDRSTNAQCLKYIGYTLQMQSQYEEARLKLKEAHSDFIIIGDRFGATRCLQSLGEILRMRDQYEEA